MTIIINLLSNTLKYIYWYILRYLWY